jgi:signal transduction histidine kinase/ligand-binding sensor domain-containing protein/DNA-binding response OmpR family regulator
MKKFLLIQTLLFVLLSNLVFAQVNDIRFRQISPPGGFTLDGIKCIIQDDLGYMWMATSQGLIKYDSKNTKWFVPSTNDSLSIPSEVVNNIFCDANNQIWVATNRGLCKFIREQQKFERINYTYEDGSKSSKSVVAVIKTEDDRILVIDESYFGFLNLKTKQFTRIGKNLINAPTKLYKDNSNRIWIGTLSGDIFRFFPSKNTVTKVITSEAKVNSIYSENKQIYIGTEGEGAKLYNLNGEFIKQISFSNSALNSKPGNVRVIHKDTYGRFWFGTYEGLYMDDGNQLTRFKPDNYPGLPHNSIYEIFEDKHGALWFGTWTGGVALIHHSDNNFQTFRHSPSRNSISNSMASSFVQVNKNELLIGTEVGGLNSFNLNTGEFDIIHLADNEEIETIKSLCKDKYGGIWVGTFRKGLWYRPTGSSVFTQFHIGPDDGKHISSVSVYSLCAVDSGVWIGTFHDGLNFYSFKTKTIRHCFLGNSSGIPMNNLVVNSILNDSKSNLWLGTYSGILYKIHLPSGSISQYETEESANKYKLKKPINQLENNAIFYLMEGDSGNIWCGTNNKGILIFNPDSSHFKSFNADGVLAGKNVYGIIEDQNKKIWITSNNGLIVYNPETKATRHFLYSDGIQSNIFCPQAVYKDTQNFLYFGGTNGFTKINPDAVKLNSRKPFTVINKVTTKNNKSIYPVYSTNFKIKPIELNPEETTFRISFSADNYLMPEKNKYKYRLVNFYDEWIDIENEGTVLFTSLDAGEYIFEVLSCNNDGIWSDAPTQMLIEIRNYWYKSTLAYIVYLTLLFSLLYFIGRFYFERIKLQQDVLREKNQRENEEQLHEMKLKFFTNISHEFRTPLTLITWPLKKILDAENITEEQREELEVVKRNSNRLLQLINQIVDLRKLEKGKNKLNISKIDIIDFIKEMQQGFSSETKSREINFILESPYSAVEIEADREKLDAMLYNLPSNAYNYVSTKGQIKITVNKEISTETSSYSNQLSFGEIHVDDFIEIAIADTGTGIDNEALLKIFTRFEPGKQTHKKGSKKIKGSGIGLSMCKDYTLLHHGKIKVQSNSGKGTRFTILLPTKQKAQKILFESHQKIKNLKVDESLTVQVKKDRDPERNHQILVVEDNPDFSKFITKYLKQYYQVARAANGKEALSILQQRNINLIISDVMMPEMDGFEFCNIVKTQIETSHIPVILLTALSSNENLIAGLDKGADAYLTKPFDENVLLKQIENILEQRRRIHENFSKQFISQKTVEVSSIDNYFLKQVRTVIEKNMMNESFGIENLAEELMISRSKLHRKIKSLSGITTSEFVNLVRIKKAVELITKENYMFSEVAYQVGFSSQSYFNRCFKKVYNVTPKEYFAKNNK